MFASKLWMPGPQDSITYLSLRAAPRVLPNILVKVVSKFHSPSPSSLGEICGKTPSGIKRYSFEIRRRMKNFSPSTESFPRTCGMQECKESRHCISWTSLDHICMDKKKQIKMKLSCHLGEETSTEWLHLKMSTSFISILLETREENSVKKRARNTL